jgi:predicted nucleotidyltransferase
MEPRIPINIHKIKLFCEKWNVKELNLFSSALRDNFGPDSDVNVVIKMANYDRIGLYEWLDMIEELQEIFGRKVDLVSTDGVRNPFVRLEIARSRRLIHAS